MKRKNFEQWEVAFIYLANKDFSHKEIAEHLGRTKGSIQTFLSRNQWLKKNYFLKINNGDRFDSLVVLEKSFVRKRCQYYSCQCDCGNKVDIRAGSLGEKNSTTCGKCYEGDQEQLGMIYRGWFRRIKNVAKYRLLEFSVDMQFLDYLLKKQNCKCAYTKFPIEITKHTAGLGSTASLDRIDSTKGYIRDNVQFLHKYINKMKWELNHKDFIKICKTVAKNFENEE